MNMKKGPFGTVLIHWKARSFSSSWVTEARVDQVFKAAPEPDALPKQGVHRTGGVTLVQQKLRQEWRPTGQLGFATVRHHAMRDGVQPAEDGGVGRLRGDAGRKHFFEEHSLAGQRIDMRTGRLGIPIASQVIGAQRIRRDQNYIGFCLHESTLAGGRPGEF